MSCLYGLSYAKCKAHLELIAGLPPGSHESCEWRHIIIAGEGALQYISVNPWRVRQYPKSEKQMLIHKPTSSTSHPRLSNTFIIPTSHTIDNCAERPEGSEADGSPRAYVAPRPCFGGSLC